MTNRPTLAVAAGVGAAAAVALGLAPTPPDPVLRLVAGFDVAALVFVLVALWRMGRSDVERIRQVAARRDEGRGLILAVVVVACVMSLAAVAVGMNPDRRDGGIGEILRVLFAGGSVAISWFLVQLVFALHYAHEYYGEGGGEVGGGLAFPGGESPDYWDFLHFALVIGAASQTADISFTTQRMRRFGTVHTLVAFVFNTAVLALAINLMASLIGS
jgi:uncharacterized membrane protein